MDNKKKGLGLTTQIFLGLILGIGIGYYLYETNQSIGIKYIKPIGDVFIHMVKMIVVPLIFSSLVTGIASTGDFQKLGRLGVKSIIWFEVATTVALIFGLLAANIFQPGVGITPPTANSLALKEAAKQSIELIPVLVNMVPVNVVDAAARSDMLQLVFFSTFFGVAAASLGKLGEPVVLLTNSISEIMFKVTWYVMKCAPLGVFSLTAYTISQFGLEVLLPLGKLIGSLYAALFVFTVLILIAALVFARINIIKFLRSIKDPVLIAFSTASSEAALPMAMEKLEKFGLPKNIITFVLPTGYTFNLCGSSLYSALAVVFVAQIYHIDLPLYQQLIMLGALMLSTKGIAAIPGASLIVIAGSGRRLP